MAESITESDALETEGPARGGSFLFEPVGARPFMTPEKFTDLQRQFYQTGHDFSSREVSTPPTARRPARPGRSRVRAAWSAA